MPPAQLPCFSGAPVQIAKTTDEPMDLDVPTSPSADSSTSTASANSTTSTLSSTPAAHSQPIAFTPQQALHGHLLSSTYISPYEPSAPSPALPRTPASVPPTSTSTNSTFIAAPAPSTSTSTSTSTFHPPTNPPLSASTTALLARVTTTPTAWESARAQILSQMTTTYNLSLSTPSTNTSLPTSSRRGRGARASKRASPAARGTIKVQRTGDPNSDTPTNDNNNSGLLIENEPGTTTPASTRGRGRGRGSRGGRPRGSGRGGTRGGKRKRSSSSASGKDEDGGADTSASETYTPLPTSSRSGRPLLKPQPFFPSPATLDSNPLANKRKRRHYRRPGEASVCKNCGRGHSPESNAIVFCDGCNAGWHQFCHDPVIGGEVVREREREWVCGGCESGGRVAGKGLGERVRGEGWGAEEKRRYFEGLPHTELVSLLLHASALHSDLPLFAPDAKPTVAVKPSPAVQQQQADRDTNTELVDLASLPTDEESEYEELLSYPKAGNGIKLPPESEDLAVLVDDDMIAFSHTWRDTGFEMVDEPFVGAGFVDGGGQTRGLGLGLVSVGA
ncbi:Zinc finger, RING/FYVE/PHD-type [Lasallia pustulata]|uniref:Zinc finger, RING/FYVE/PHD-type n=1 Tax=Lasallia pustulata TaxID=136370 RepID=A0A1W5DDK3_9LECA|nr:Zinc finger, RING/FYVE/PHD-type [Lasallia pustulata]